MEDTRQTFRDIDEEARHFRITQLTKYTHIYSATFNIPFSSNVNIPTTLEAVLQVMEDADFHITHVVGSVCSPVNVDGTRIIDVSSALGLLFPMAGSDNRPDRGVSFKIIDPRENRRFTTGRITKNAVDLAAQNPNYDHSFVEFGTVFGPGYDYTWGKPVAFNYFLEKSRRYKIMIQNLGIITYNLQVPYTRISMGFIGNRYAG
jgi:hypothetical protein